MRIQTVPNGSFLLRRLLQIAGLSALIGGIIMTIMRSENWALLPQTGDSWSWFGLFLLALAWERKS